MRFLSTQISYAEWNYASVDKRLLAIVKALEE